MAQDSETPKSVDKGKGKAVDGETSNGKEVEKDKDGKPLANGTKDEPIIGGMVDNLNVCSGLVTLFSFRGTQRGGSTIKERTRHAC